ncbi:TOG array regulator of axonemal microtubules protein 1 [Parus major]|uniref:TOG array regulator of axonemal microtubules protein 1 n=1 Tax=Parus major TaxID=9157 RepID=UPI00077161D5|nr:TOG array regulator of axonemal microtubules protein 1 [Parus major]
MAEPPPGAAAPRGRGRAWERGGSAQDGENGTEPSGTAHNGSSTELPGPALNGSGTDAPGPIHNGSDTEPPGPNEDGPGTEPPSPAHNASDTEPPSPAEDGPGTEPPSPEEDAAPPLGPELSLVPPELRARLLDRRDYRGRAQAVEQLRRAVEGCSPAALSAAPAAALLGLIALLDALLHDPNFAVARGALEVTRLLALRLGRRVPAVLAPLVCAAARALGDAQPAMRRDSGRLLLRLMAAAGPRPVLRLLLQERLLRHRSARLREELLNTCIAALLTYPAAQLDLPQLAAALAPALLDAKRRVRHAAMEALAALGSALGPGNNGALLRALEAVELRAGGAGVVHAVQARLARKVLPRLGEQGLVEYGVPSPSCGLCRGPCQPPGADTEWLLMGSRSRSAHGHCGHPACAQRRASPRRVLSAGRGKNKLPWENEPAADREGGSGVRMPVTKGVEQLAASSDFPHSLKLHPPQGIPGSEELFPSRSRTCRPSLQPSVELNLEHPVLSAGALGSHQPQISGKCGTLGHPQARGKSGSVGSDLQFLGLNNCQQDKVCSSLSFSSKTQRSFCTQAEPTTSFQGPSGSQGSFILPSFPLSSPRNSPKQLSAPAASPGKSQEDPRSLSSSWPLKSFQGLPKPGCQRQLLSQKPGDSTGDSPLEKPSLHLEKPSLQLERNSLQLERNSLQLERNSMQLEKPPMQLEKPPLQLRAGLGRVPGGLRGSRPVPPIPRLPREGSEGAELQLEPEEVDQEELWRIAPIKCVYLNRSDTFPALGSKSHPAKVSPARPRDAEGAEHHPSTGPAESVPGFAPKNDLEFTPEDVAVVGKGVFGSAPAPAPSQSMPCVATGDSQAAREGAEPAPGRSFQQNSTSHSHCHAGSEGEIKVTLSKSAQEKLRRKRKEDREHNHKEQESKDLEGKEEFPWERIRLSMSEPEKLTAERFNLCGDLLTSPRNGSLSLENVALNPSLKRTSSLKRSKCSSLLDSEEPCPAPRGRCREPPVPPSPEVLDPTELQPFPRPEAALAEALALLADHDWEKKIEGLNFVRCLSAYHAPILTAKLHETTLAVAQEVKNLRSGVSRAAVVCLGDLFTHLKKSMDQELDNAVKVLLHKAGESNTFIREEVDKALKAMVNNVTPARALCSLINGGQSHLHSAVRRCTAQHLGDAVQRLGPERILAGARPAAERLLPAIARFTQDSSQQTRYYGRRMLFIMMAHPDLDKTLEKFVPAKDLPYIKETVGTLREKGLGEMPLDTPSAKGRRSQTGNVGHLRSSSTCRDAPIIPDRDGTEAQEAPRRAAPRSALESEEYVRDIVGLLNAKDFRERISGVRQLLLDTESSPALVLANVVRIFDAFKPRLHDSNSKVNQAALETMHKMIPLLKDNLSPVINMLIPAIVDNNLNSKNPGIYAAATNVVQALCQHLDTSLLLQPFCTKAQFLSGKAKQDLTEKLAELVPELYPRKPCAVEQKVLPVLWHLLGPASGGSVPGPRTAAASLARALWAQMGPGLLAHAAAQPPHIGKSLEELLEM